MERLPLIDPNDEGADPLVRQVLGGGEGAAGGVIVQPNVFRAAANHPRVLQALAQFATVAYYRNSLTPAQRELAYLTASVTNDCHY